MADDGPNPNANSDGQACTIYAPRVVWREVWEAVRESGLPFTLEGSIDEWSRLVVDDGETTLTLSTTKRGAPMDKVSKILLGTANFFNRIPSAPPDRQKLIASAIFKCQMLVGVRGRPEFTEEHLDLIYEIARVCEGLIFNGSAMLDADGKVLLRSDGSYDA